MTCLLNKVTYIYRRIVFWYVDEFSVSSILVYILMAEKYDQNLLFSH